MKSTPQVDRQKEEYPNCAVNFLNFLNDYINFYAPEFDQLQVGLHWHAEKYVSK